MMAPRRKSRRPILRLDIFSGLSSEVPFFSLIFRLFLFMCTMSAIGPDREMMTTARTVITTKGSTSVRTLGENNKKMIFSRDYFKRTP